VRIVEINGVQLAARAIEKCLAWRKPRRLEPGGYEVILEPAAAGDLVRLMAMSFDARASEEGRTFLSRKGGGTLVGEKLFPESITLRSDPLAARLPSLPWTNSLLPSRPVTFVERGVVRALSRDRYWAARTKLEPVPFPSSLVLDGEDRPLEELIRAAKRAVLVTHFWYIRPVNLRTLQHTGLTRNGLFLVEDGKITAPVMNLRFTDSPVRLLEKTRMLGRPIRVRGLEGGSMIAPALLSSEFVFTSVSDAV
jgi:predicted Zn-dependent protease